MKRIITMWIRSLAILTLLLHFTKANAQPENFQISVKNLTQTGSNKLEFDVFLLDTDPVQPFELASCQLGFLINSLITSGSLSFTYDNTGSGLNASQQFSSPPAVVSNLTGYPNQTLLKLAGRGAPGAGNGTIISTSGFGTFITHYIVTSSVDFTSNSTPNLEFISSGVSSPLYPTRVNEYINSLNTSLTVTPGTNALVTDNPILNPPVTPPTAFNVTGTGSYCPGSGGTSVGLSNSELGVTYTLYKNTVAQTPTINGTGSPITFGNQLFGTYEVSGSNIAGTTPMTGSAVITENALPTITGTLIVCEGSSTQLTGSGTPSGTSPWISASPTIATITGTGLVTGVAAGSSIITYTDNNGCSTTATITVKALPTITGTLTVCAGSSTQLTGSGTPSGTSPWVSASPTIATITGTGLVTGVAAGSSIITYTDNNVCSTTATITVKALPIITGTLTVCAGSSTQLTGSGTPSGTSPWLSASPTIATITGTGLVTGVAAGSSIITYTDNNGCSITATITVKALPTITGTLTVCTGSSTQLTGSGTPSGTSPWVSASPTIATITGTGLVTGVAAGSSIITYTDNNGCSITATITVKALPTITGTLTVCAGSSTQLTGSGTPSGTSPWISASPTIATITGTGLVTGVAAGSSIITYTDNNGCSITATITVKALPTITGTLTVCAGSSTQLTGSGTPSGTSPWVSASPTIATITGTGLVTGVAAGSSIITYTDNNVCSTTATITVKALPTITGTLTVCAGSSTQLTGSGTPSGTSPWISASPTIAVITGTGLVTGVAAGSSIITYTDNNGCSTTATANVNSKPPAPTGASTQTFCSGVSPIVSNLSATGTAIKWYNSAISGSQYQGTDPLLNGTHYYASQTSIAGCESTARLDVIVIVNTSPAAPTGSVTQTFCSGTLPTISGLSATGNAIQWYPSASGGSALLGSTVLENNTHYFASQTVGGCESLSRLDVTAVVNTTPGAPSGNSSQTFCSGTSPTIANLTVSGTGVKWYDSSAGGNLLTSSTPLSNSVHYYASQTINGCESISRLDVAAFVTLTPNVTNQTTSILTGGTFIVIPGGAGVPAGTTYTWTVPTYVGGVTGGSAQSTPQSTISGTLSIPSGAGTANYTVTPINGSCVGTDFTVTVIVTSSCVPVTIDTQPTDRSMCVISGSATFTIGTTGTSPFTFQWEYFNGSTWTNVTNGTPSGAVYSGSNNASFNITGITQSGNSQYRCLVTNCGGGISITSNYVTLTVNALPVAPTIGSVVQPGCTVSTGTINISGPSGSGIFYSIDGATYTNSTGIFTLVPPGVYTITAKNASGCVSPGTIVTINTQPATPVAPTVSIGQPTCNLSTGYIVVTAPSELGMTYSIDGSTYSNTSGFFNPVSTGSYSVTARNTAGCTSPTIPVTINSQPPTPAVSITNPDPVCSPSTVNLTVDAVTSGSTPNLTYTYWMNEGATIPYMTPTTAVAGTYYIKGTNSAGCFNIKPVTVTVNQTPTANPGLGGNSCDLNFKLNAVPSIGTGSWIKTSGPGSVLFIPDATSATATASVSEYGTYIFTWTEVSNTCSKSSSITVNFYQQPEAKAGTGTNNCGPEYILAAIPSIGTGTWTKISGPGTASFTPNANSPNAKVTVSAYGTYFFRWTEVNGTCSSSSSVNVSFFQVPAANAGEDGSDCDLDYILNAIPAVGTGTWTKVSGPGNATFSPDQNQPDAKVTVDQSGEYEFGWTDVNSTCQSVDIVKIIFRSLPNIYAGRDTIICKGSSLQLDAEGTGTFKWYPDSLLSDPNIKNPVATPTLPSSFRATITDQFGCNNSDTIFIDVWEMPVADAGRDTILQYIFTTSLAARALKAHETGLWSVVSGSGSFSDPVNPISQISGLSTGENKLLWKVTNKVCPVSEDNLTIVVIELVIPTLITPNMDGKNDYFVLRGIETLGKTELTIFDRRGAQVFKSSNYDNTWNGIDFNNNPLPDDTYFYIIRAQNGKSISGYIVIRR